MRAVVFVSTVYNPEERLYLGDRAFEAVHENEIANDFDLIAVEAAVRLKEQGHLDEVVVFGLAPTHDHLQKALAMGADRAVYGECDNGDLTPEKVVDTALSSVAPTEDTLWMTGKIGVNFESHKVPQLLASRLGCPCICSAFQIEKVSDRWRISCEDDRGIPIFEAVPPFVVSSELRLAEPRFPSLPSIIKAKKKPFEYIKTVSGGAGASETRSLESAMDTRRNCQWISVGELLERVKESSV